MAGSILRPKNILTVLVINGFERTTSQILVGPGPFYYSIGGTQAPWAPPPPVPTPMDMVMKKFSLSKYIFLFPFLWYAVLPFHVRIQCSESVTLKFCDVDGHLSQTMQKIATRMGLHFITSRKKVYVCGPFDLLHQFRMDLRAEIFVTAQCSNITPVIFQSVQTTMAIPKKTPQLFNAPQEIIYSSVTLRSDGNPPEQQMTMHAGIKLIVHLCPHIWILLIDSEFMSPHLNLTNFRQIYNHLHVYVSNSTPWSTHSSF